MSRNFDTRPLFRSVVVLSLLGAGHAIAGCSSSDTPAQDPGASLGGFGGLGFHLPDGSVNFGGAAGFGFGGSGVGGGQGGFVGGGGSNFGGSNFGGTAGTGTAGAAGGGGVAGAAGGGAGGEPGDGSTDAPACVVPTTLLPTTAFKACDTPTSILPNCMNGVCVPSSIVPTASQKLLASCVDPTNLCVPTYFVARAAKFIPPTCTSLKNAEGRCLSQCIPQVAAQETFLPKDNCDTGDLCAPCYDPRTGADTGACTQGCDTGPTKPPVLFDKCCSGTGSCVPKSVVPASAQSLLGTDTCKTAGEVCAPNKLSDLTVKPKVCTSIGGAEGRCMADCIPAVAAQASRLKQDVCDTHELCAPCFDPFTGLSTGACDQNGDKPANPTPVTFPTCCTNLGHCVPTNVLTTDQQKLLGADTCTGANLCAPDVFAESGVTADTCRALGSLNAEGRCVPECVPSVAAQKDRLDQGTPPTCATGMLCAPCYDPITGADTGACTQNGDKPAETKKVFPTCCGGLGVCVQPSLVPVSQQSQLGVDTCTDKTNLCAPKSLTDPTVTPPTCRAPGDIEGRCLPSCLPTIQTQAANLRQQTCATGELCADCYNPIDGTDTTACEINGDKPKEAPKLFATCGIDGTTTPRGLCVPTVLVPASLASQIPQDTCKTGELCAPTEKVKDINYKFPSCAPQIPPLPPDPNQKAVCLPKYIIDFQAKTNTNAGLLGQSSCKAGEICAPCVDPLTQKSTGACN